MKIVAALFGVVIATLLTVAMLFTAGWVHPPILSTQAGFRGLALNQLTTPAAKAKLELANALPAAIEEGPPDGPKASEVYQNVQVLKDLSAVQFNTLMAAITTWVAPDQGCNYCHNPDNLADDGKYTKKVARRMIQMVQHVNTDYKAHVANTGVVCWTCHRGNPIPKYTWTNGEGYPQATGGFATTNRGMGHPSWANGSTALLQDPYGPLDSQASVVNVRVQPTRALPLNSNGPSYQDAENTYSLMIAMSKGLGVNCTFCHNSRAFWSWEESLPQRVTAWHGMQMARDLNVSYLDPLKDLLPAERLGKLGDAPKANCMTCHQGANKPLLGVSLAKDWPALGGTAAK
ncbi:photosynthetic reaction center cytochrome c subunit [Roseiarcus fermentans]|uniref:Photosynthetic reaction center cytochrome c subunit n=1 Tax=Roseiarcus fermentans TaxID=1473586 RepID=A0A366EMF2_9HYPH|nr:photosynthetic reaction center cytochrome PufC [Roseiarcus fermentans]RBP02890.1 photosynthetic reaction center cytochrome c subunit [Roseiarcus fermentans]